MEDRIEIPLSKTKLSFLLIGSAAFVFIGILMILYAEESVNTRFRNPETIRIVGVIGVAFFGLGLIVIIKRLFDNKSGLTINDWGINDNSHWSSIGLIEWTDIKSIRSVGLASSKFLMLDTDSPEKYIDRAKNWISKVVMKANYKLYGSPLTISPNSLKFNHEDLEELIKDRILKAKIRQQNKSRSESSSTQSS